MSEKEPEPKAGNADQTAKPIVLPATDRPHGRPPKLMQETVRPGVLREKSVGDKSESE